MEELGMARQSKRDYLRSIHKRYRQARRQEKSAMLEEFARICGYNRKYAIWLLKRPLPQSKAHRRRGKRSVTYSQGTITTLAKVWEASGYLCSQRLKAALPQWLPWVKKHFDNKLKHQQYEKQRQIRTQPSVRFADGLTGSICGWTLVCKSCGR